MKVQCVTANTEFPSMYEDDIRTMVHPGKKNAP